MTKTPIEREREESVVNEQNALTGEQNSSTDVMTSSSSSTNHP